MKIALFSDTYFPIINGISVSVSLLAKELRKKGHTVVIFTHNHDQATPEKDVVRFKGFKVPKRSLQEFRIGRVTQAKIKKVMEDHFDIIHCHTELTVGRIGKKVAKVTSTPLVYTYHTMYEDYVHYISKYFKKYTRKFVIYYSVRFANQANMLIAPTDKVASKFASYQYKGPLKIIPTGIDLQRFKKEALSKEHLDELKKKYDKPFPHGVFVGRISHEKNLLLLLETLKSFLHHQHGFNLTLIGDGPARKSLETYVKENQLSNHVTFTGMIPQEDIPYYYRLADFFVSLSTTETQGLTYIEALAADLPVLAQEDSHLKEWIIEGQSGFLFKDVEAFKIMMKKISQDPTLITALKPSQMDILKPLSSETYAASVENVYQELLQKRSK
jgi:1,2-diacylglycerol 3-alpha-glucosyltransferase